MPIRAALLLLSLSGCAESHTGADAPSAVGDAAVCPAIPPSDGSPCAVEHVSGTGPQCTYASPCGTLLATCSGGHWGASSCARP